MPESARNPLTHAVRGCALVVFSVAMLPVAAVLWGAVWALTRGVADDEEGGGI